MSGTPYNTDGLLTAIRNNDIRMVKLFVRSEIDLNLLGASGVSPLCVAASTGNLDIVNVILKGDVNLLKKNSSDGLTPVFCAIEGNNVQVLDRLKDAGLIISTRNDRTDGISPLHYATALGRDSMTSYFIKNGADVNLSVKSYNGNALARACTTYNVQAVRNLLDAKASVDITCGLDKKMLIDGVLAGCQNIYIPSALEICEMLLQAGAKTSEKTKGYVEEIGKRFEFFRNNISSYIYKSIITWKRNLITC